MSLATDLRHTADAVCHGMPKNDRAVHGLGIEVASVTPGAAVMGRSVREDMLNGFGIRHGGLIADARTDRAALTGMPGALSGGARGFALARVRMRAPCCHHPGLFAAKDDVDAIDCQGRCRVHPSYDAALQACDGADGIIDGLISDPASCNASFDPATARLNGRPLRCADGGDTGDSCLSDAQIQAMKVIDTPIVFERPLANGDTQYPGFNTWGTDFGRPASAGVQVTVNFLGLNSVAPGRPMPVPPAAGTAGPPYGSIFWDQWVRYFVTRDPAFDSLSLDPERPGRWAARISELSGLQDANQVDLDAFERRGGKLLMAHGTADQLVSTRATQQYWGRLRATMGAARTDGFARYFEIPGYNHAASATYNAAWDSLGALDDWVAKGAAPVDPVVFDTAGVPGRSRPLCRYPSWPKYRGAGDVNLASSFVCS